MHPVQHLRHFLIIAFVHGTHGSSETRFRIFYQREFIVAVLFVQCIPVAGVFQFHCRPDVSGLQFRHLHPVLSCHGKQLAHALFGLIAHVGKVFPFFQCSGHHLEIIYISEMRLNGSRKDKYRCRAIFIIRHQGTVHRLGSGHGSRTRCHIDQKFHESSDTHIFFSRYAEYGEHIPLYQSCPDSGSHLIFGEAPFFKIELHQLVVVFSSSLHQGIMQFVGSLFFGFGDRQHFRFSALRFPFVHFHFQHIHHHIEVRPLIDRILH